MTESAPPAPAPIPAAARPPARFTTGSTMRHVLEMTGTGAIGLIAIFVVDFLSLFYVARLGDHRLTAGVGYATTMLFIAISFNIGAMIAGSALVARAIGSGDRERARRLASSSLVLTGGLAVIVSVVMLVFRISLLDAIGASGVPLEVASRFLAIVLPANVLMAIGMMLSGILRAVGDPRRAMKVTLYGGMITAISDPILIFWAGLGTDGAAWATVLARLIFAAVGFHGVLRVHDLLARPRLAAVIGDARAFLDVAGPAILTNIATPVSNLLLLRILAPFGEAAIAANAILDRLVPVAFGVLFALSGAVGPILGQNLGAKRHDRLRQAMRDSLVFALVYCLLAWLLLVLLRHHIAEIFDASGDAARYVAFFCMIGGMIWTFNGFLFVANAAFNNLGFALYSTGFNWGRATIGTLPFAWIGGQLGGVEGVMLGMLAGSVLFGLASVATAFSVIRTLESRHQDSEA